jgi:hypothetical protein
MDGGRTFYSFGIDVHDHQRARRDLDLVLARMSRRARGPGDDAADTGTVGPSEGLVAPPVGESDGPERASPMDRTRPSFP